MQNACETTNAFIEKITTLGKAANKRQQKHRLREKQDKSLKYILLVDKQLQLMFVRYPVMEVTEAFDLFSFKKWHINFGSVKRKEIRELRLLFQCNSINK